MKRFIDLRGQGTGYRFAYFDTTFDEFERHNCTMVWDTFHEFATDYEGPDLERHAVITPPWAFEPGTDDIDSFYWGIKKET